MIARSPAACALIPSALIPSALIPCTLMLSLLQPGLAAAETILVDDDPPAPPVSKPRGPFFSVMTGFSLGTATDEDAVSQGSFTGSALGVRFGESIADWGQIGFEIGGSFGKGEGYEASLGGLALEAGLRPLPEDTPELLILLGLGLGGGGLTPKGDEGPDGTGGGVMYTFGAIYELDLVDPERAGFTLGPSLRVRWTPPQSGSEVTLSTVTLGVELTYYGGQ